MEKLRDNFVRAVTLPEKKAAADAVQVYAMQVITHVPLGEWFTVSAASDKVEFPTPLAPVPVFWGISKK
jgi:peptide/nickel transport system substrate-binding protein